LSSKAMLTHEPSWSRGTVKRRSTWKPGSRVNSPEEVGPSAWVKTPPQGPSFRLATFVAGTQRPASAFSAACQVASETT
jgi:hypothetical protein